MAAKYVLIFASMLALAFTAPPPAQENHLEEIQKSATELAKTVTDQINKLTNSKNSEEFNKALKANSDELLTKITEFSSSFGKVLEDTNGKAKEAFAAASEKLQKTVEDLRKQNPQVEAQAKEIGEKIKTAISNTATETDKLAKTLAEQGQTIGDKIAPVLKENYENFVKGVEQIQKQIHEAAKKA